MPNAFDDADNFEEIIKKTHLFLKRFLIRKAPKPHIIEFTGTPTSGKTTLINGFDSILRNRGFRVMRPQEGAEVFRHISRKTPAYNITTGSYGLINVMEAANTRDYDFVLLDRALYDAHAWMIFWEGRGQLTSEERAAFQRLFTDERWLLHIDLCLYVVCAPKQAMARAKLDSPHAVGCIEGSYTNPTTIAKLIKVFSQGQLEMEKRGLPAFLLDTADLSKPEMFDRTFDLLLRSIKSRNLKSK